MIRSPLATLCLLASITISLAACGERQRNACSTRAECASTEDCVGGACAPANSDAGRDAFDGDVSANDVMTIDAPLDANSAIGQRCSTSRPCPSGFTCEGGLCALDCGANARCAETTCCAAGDVCSLDRCITPGAACASAPAGDAGTCVAARRCGVGEQCDPAIGRCLPVPTTACEFHPTGTFDPQLLWSWTGSRANPTYGHAITTPAVADLDGDGSNDVIVPVIDQVLGTQTRGAILCALSGAGDCAGGPRELWCTTPTDPLVSWLSSPAVADLDGSGVLTIVTGDTRPDANGLLNVGIAGYTPTGQRIPMFGTDSAGAPVNVRVGVGAPGIADLDGDGHAEVFVGYTVFDSHGRLRWQHAGAAGNSGFGPLTIAADLDGDGTLEIVGGNMAYHADGTEAWPATAAARSLADGWPAMGDFDGDGVPEIAVMSNGTLNVLTHDGALYSATPATIPGRGGPPTIADVDGDGHPDIAVAGSNSITVFKVAPTGTHAITQLWRASARDFSSNFTGSSVFDFDGDGRAEVIYGDECFARVYDGRGDGAGGTTVRFEVPNTSCTGVEYPVVADLNGDGRAEFVVVANDASGMGTACSSYAEACGTTFPGYTATHGVRAYRDRRDNWVATRGIWNQHAYHVTNVCDGRDGACTGAGNRYAAVPAHESSPWRFPAGAPLNSYRTNAQIGGALAAPDLVARDLRTDLTACPGTLGVTVNVVNIGASGVPAGAPVSFYAFAADGTRTLISSVRTTRVLLAGASETIHVEWNPVPANAQAVPMTIEVRVDDDGTGQGIANECVEDNNVTTRMIVCDSIG